MKKISYILAAGLMVGSVGCSGLVEDLNVDPNNPTSVPLESHFTGTLINNSVFHEGHLARQAGIWSQQFTGSDRQYAGINTYITSSGDYDGYWANVFVLGLNQHRTLQTAAQEAGNDDIYNISRIVEAHIIGTAASLWGDIPYSQAVNPAEHEFPSFDAQMDVYAAVDALLSSAASDIGTGNGALASDLYFGGDRDAWAATAQTLRARFALHQGDYADAVSLIANGISSSGQSMITTHGAVQNGNSNMFWMFEEIERGGYMDAQNATAVSMLLGDPADASDDDPRLNMFYMSEDWTDPTTWKYNTGATGFFAIDQDYPLVTFEEALLIEAEANARTGNDAAAQAALVAFYNHIDDNGLYGYALDDDGVDSYPDAVTETGAALIDLVMTERYLTFIGQIEAWTDIRRSVVSGDGIQLTPTDPAQTNVPMRLLYPDTELNSNSNTPQDRTLFYRDAIFQ